MIFLKASRATDILQEKLLISIDLFILRFYNKTKWKRCCKTALLDASGVDKTLLSFFYFALPVAKTGLFEMNCAYESRRQ